MQLSSSISDQSLYFNHNNFTYICLVNYIKPSDTIQNIDSESNTALIDDDDEMNKDQPIKMERTKALHELIDSEKRNKVDEENIVERESAASHLTEESNLPELEESPNFILYDNPNVLKLTKMKWLTEEREGLPDSRSPSLSSSITPTMTSSTSNCSDMSNENLGDINDKCLSTIIQLDREYNMFGLSHMAIVGIKPKQKGKDNKPVFPQRAIVQVCCPKPCCRHKSNTDLPASLKCGGCVTCCSSPCPKKPCCPRPPPICKPPPPCPSCFCKCSAPSPACDPDTSVFGLTVKLTSNTGQPRLPVVQLTPRGSSILTKPAAARPCSHNPCCVPPSNCFPYLMPCFWPPSPGAPCSEPAKCFHNPPCRAPRKIQRVPLPAQYRCLKKCALDGKGPKCPNEVCPGKIPGMKAAIESFGKKAAPPTGKQPKKQPKK